MRSIGGETHGAVLRLIIAELALLIVGLWAVSFCCSSHIQEAMDIFARSQVMTVSRRSGHTSCSVATGPRVKAHRPRLGLKFRMKRDGSPTDCDAQHHLFRKQSLVHMLCAGKFMTT